MQSENKDFQSILDALAKEGIEFIVVGGVCAVFHGAPVSTMDIDAVYSRSPENLKKLEKVLRKIGAAYRMKPEFFPDAERLDTSGHHQLITRYGPLDLLGSTVGGGYPELIEHTETVELEEGMEIHILDLPTLIKIKETLGGERDKLMIPILKRALQEKSGKDE